MPSIPPAAIPTPDAHQPDPLSDSRALEEMAKMMHDLDTHDSMGLTDSAVGLILNCADETDSAVQAAQLEIEMVKSLDKLSQAQTPNPPTGQPSN